MANDLGSNPWVLDTAAATVLYSGFIVVKAFEWSEYTADAHTIVIKDTNGKEIWSVNGASDLSPIQSTDIGPVQGLALTTLDSGKLRVFYD